MNKERITFSTSTVFLKGTEREAWFKAATCGKKDIIESLLLKNPDVNTKSNSGGETALINAAWNGHKDVVKLLLENNADVDAKDDKGRTALIRAARILSNPDPEHFDIEGWSELAIKQN